MFEKESAKELMQTMEKLRKLHMQKMGIDGLNKAEFMMLASIGEAAEDEGNQEGITVSELARIHQISMPVVTQMINALVKKGAVERHAGARDRRAVYHQITPEGAKTLAAAHETFEKFTALVLERLGEEDTKKLIGLFSRLYEIIQEIHQKELLK